jgi:hypothetical protein
VIRGLAKLHCRPLRASRRSIIPGASSAELQARRVDRAIPVFGAISLTPDIPLAYLFTCGIALRFVHSPNEVRLRIDPATGAFEARAGTVSREIQLVRGGRCSARCCYASLKGNKSNGRLARNLVIEKEISGRTGYRFMLRAIACMISHFRPESTKTRGRCAQIISPKFDGDLRVG